MAEGSKSFLETVGGLVTIVGAVAALTAYCVSLQFSLNQASREIERLDKQLASITAQTSSTARGPKGDKGDPGDQGPRGERGPQGEMGPMGPSGTSTGVDAAELRRLVDIAVKEGVQKLPTASGVSTVVDVSGGFDLSKCLPAAQVKASKVISVKKGTEFCDADGALLAKVEDVRDRAVLFSAPGENGWWLDSGYKRSFKWDSKREYYLERVSEDSGTKTAAIRFAEKN